MEAETTHIVLTPTKQAGQTPKWALELCESMRDIKAWQANKDEVLAKLDMKID